MSPRIQSGKPAALSEPARACRRPNEGAAIVWIEFVEMMGALVGVLGWLLQLNEVSNRFEILLYPKAD